MNDLDLAAYITDTERRVCRLLSTLNEQSSMTRFQIGRELFKVNGGTILASVLGGLLSKGYVERRPCAFHDPHPRFRLTSRGRLAVELLDLLEGRVA